MSRVRHLRLLELGALCMARGCREEHNGQHFMQKLHAECEKKRRLVLSQPDESTMTVRQTWSSFKHLSFNPLRQSNITRPVHAAMFITWLRPVTYGSVPLTKPPPLRHNSRCRCCALPLDAASIRRIACCSCTLGKGGLNV